MSFTSTEELRIEAIESKLNTFQRTIKNLSAKETLKQLLLVSETLEVTYSQIVDETVNMGVLTDTNLTNLADNQILQYDLPTTKWINVEASQGSASNLGQLLDVTLGNTITDQSVILYDDASSEWIDVSLLTLDASTGTITMVPADPGVIKVAAGYAARTEVDDNTLITKGYTDQFIPAPPTSFPGTQTLALLQPSVGNDPKLCSPKSGVSAPDLTGGGTITAVPGDTVYRIISGTTLSTNTVTATGPGNSGTLTAFIVGTDEGSIALTSADNAGTYTKLVVSNNLDYPPDIWTPGFHQIFDASVSNWSASPPGAGWNRVYMTHSTAGSTNHVYFLEDILSQDPTFQNLNTATVTQDTAGTQKVITGISQYSTGGVVKFSGVNVLKVTEEAYYGGSDPLIVQTTAKTTSIASNTKNYVAIGAPGGAIPEREIATLTLNNITVSLDSDSGYGEKEVELRFKTVEGITTDQITSTKLLFASGNPSISSDIDESVGIIVTGLTSNPNSNNAIRIETVGGADNPVVNHTSTYNHATNPPLTAAAINVAGILGFSIRDYSTGYLPVGSDLSNGRANDQYATFKFQRTPVSKFDIQFDGKIAGLWVRLPGVTDAVSSQNGWLDMSIPYLGVGNPGDQGASNGSLGCALAGIAVLNTAGAQRRTCTLGGLSSSGATDNHILVRIKFTSGQEITQLVFREASN